jgi:hypothetical protein
LVTDRNVGIAIASNSDDKQHNEELYEGEALLSRLLQPEAPRTEPLDMSHEAFLLGSMKTATKVNIDGSCENLSSILTLCVT